MPYKGFYWKLSGLQEARRQTRPLSVLYFVYVKSVSNAAKNARIQQREEQAANREFLRDEEGELCGPGIADWIVSSTNRIFFIINL